MRPSLLERMDSWVNRRWPLAKFLHWSLHEEIVGGTRFSYTLGSAALFLLIIQILSGVWQMFYYVPMVDHAYASLNYLRREVAFGWLVHGLHYWGAHAFTVVVGLHVIRVFIWGAYKKPRELVWLAGIFLLIMTAAFMFTGPVLPWDKKGYWAGEVGLHIVGSVPFIGPLLQAILQGADKMGQLTLTRLFVIHVAILPMLTVLFVIVHLIAFRKFGSVGPWREEERKHVGFFWPDQLFKDVLVAFLIFILLVGLTVFVAPPFSGLADPMDTLYTPKPEWNFLFLYECLKYFPGPFEPIGTVGIPLMIILLFFSLPFIDRSPERNPFKRVFVIACGFVFVSFIVGMTLLGLWSNPPQAQQAQEKNQSTVALEDSEKTQHGIMEMVGIKVPGTTHGIEEEINISGEKLFKSLGCTECHSISGITSGKQGPDLLMTLDQNVSRAWLWTQLVAPEKRNPHTLMPPYAHLSDHKLNALIDFLQELTMKKPKTSGVKSTIDGDFRLGSELFKSQGCPRCHTLSGKRSDKQGPDLVMSLSKKKASREWLWIQLVNPRRHNPQSLMPSYAKLNDQKLHSLIAFLEQLSTSSSAEEGEKSGEEIEPEQSPEVPATAQLQDKVQGEATTAEKEERKEAKEGVMEAIHIVGNRKHGMVLFEQHCLTCHGPQGKIHALDFPVPPRGVPALYPMRAELYTSSPEEFVRNIDPFIQHGMPNPVDGPSMPAFGDSHSLTQAQIADIEAYVLHLNGVDRAKILHPGVKPQDFFFVFIEISFLLGILMILFWLISRYIEPL
jgi:ubiquinol-cytochrome c reductase cytochrome b subunit